MSDYTCIGCSKDTNKMNEYYMVTNNIWRKFGAGDKMLCVGCLEDKMGRKLDTYDFISAPVNYTGVKSDRLRDRIAGHA